MCYTRGEQEFLSTFVIPGNIGELPRITKGGSNSRSPISSHIQELWQALICLDWQQYAEWKVLILISFIPNKFIWWQRLLKRAWVGVGTLFQTNFPGSIFCSIFLGLWCQSTNCAGSWRVWTEDNNLIKNKWDFCCSKWKRKEKKSICWRVWTEDNNLIKKNTRRDGGSTALYTVDTVFTVYNIQTALHCLNTVACMPMSRSPKIWNICVFFCKN